MDRDNRYIPQVIENAADKDRENRVIFAQREAAETAIFLTEVAGRHHGYADWRRRLERPRSRPLILRTRPTKAELERDTQSA